MQRLLPGLGLAVALAACNDPTPNTAPGPAPNTAPGPAPTPAAPGGRCDQAALKAAADATDAMLAAWRPTSGAAPDYRLAVRGLRSACPKLAPGFEFFLEYSVHPAPVVRSHQLKRTVPLRDDPDGLGPFLAHCPKYRDILAAASELPGAERITTVHDGCDYAALGLFTRDELSLDLDDPQGLHGAALYLWLLADGAPPAVARSLARPISLGSRYSLRTLVEPDAPVNLPAAAAGVVTPDFLAPLLINPDGVLFDSRRLAILTGGQLAEPDFNKGLIGALFDTLAEEADKSRALAEKGVPSSPALVISADPKTPWATAGRAAWTAMRAGFPHIHAHALGPDPLHPLVTVPVLAPGAAPTLDLVVAADSLSLRCADASHKLDLAALPARLSSCGGGPLRLAGVAGTPWQRVVDVLSALAGKATITDIAPEPLADSP